MKAAAIDKFYILFFLFINSISFSMEFTFRKTSENATHFYIEDTSLIFWNNTLILHDKYDSYLETIDLLSRAQNYEVNYLFVQFFYILEEQKTQKLRFFNLFIDQENKNLHFLPFEDSKITNFYSRLEQNLRPEIANFYINYKNASNFEDISLAHSEILFGKFFLESQKNLISSFKRDLPKIKSCGLIFYSSLDCCDYCQNFLTDSFYNNLDSELKNYPWTYLFLSTTPCKKSSYITFSGDKMYSFFYDKRKQSFFSSIEKTPIAYFPVYNSPVKIDTLKSNLTVIGHIKNR